MAVVRPPKGVGHDLILANWSRMSRRALGPFFWYLAFPFTLVNVAYEMRPVHGWRRSVHTGVLAVWSLVLSAVTACWLIALSESLFRIVDLPDEWHLHRLTLAVVLGAGIVILVMLARALKAESVSHVVWSVTHAVVVLVIALGALRFRPGEWQVEEYSWLRFFAVQGPTNEQIASRSFDIDQLDQTPLWFDPIGLVSYGVLALSLVVAIVLLATWVQSEPGPASGGSFAVLLSGVLTILISSSVHAGVTQVVLRSRESTRVFGSRDEILPAGILMSRLGRSYPTTLLPLVGLALLLILGLAVLCWVFRPRMLSWFPPKRHREHFLRWAHEMVGHLPLILFLTSATFVVLASLLGSALLTLFVEREDAGLYCSPLLGEECLPWYISAIGWLASISAVVGFFIVRNANRFPALKTVLTNTADVVGFWPITLQPLGARTYRRDAVQGITEALHLGPDQRKVLVGHSQGSVLAAWTVAHQPTTGNGTRPALVTCGTPLGSLYFRFFPQTFDDNLFHRIVAMSDGWANFWRVTDPIATPLIGPNDDEKTVNERNTRIEDPPAGGQEIFGHGEYWGAQLQRSWIKNYLSMPAVLPPRSESDKGSRHLGAS
ncbi:hypothetical protein ACX80I_06770 [Arthrobacter sp. MDT3-44]